MAGRAAAGFILSPWFKAKWVRRRKFESVLEELPELATNVRATRTKIQRKEDTMKERKKKRKTKVVIKKAEEISMYAHMYVHKNVLYMYACAYVFYVHTFHHLRTYVCMYVYHITI